VILEHSGNPRENSAGLLLNVVARIIVVTDDAGQKQQVTAGVQAECGARANIAVWQAKDWSSRMILFAGSSGPSSR
jgi:hypothetical protein